MSEDTIPQIHCSSCKTTKPASQFHRNKTRISLGGYASECKSCRAIYRKAYHLKNREAENAALVERRRQWKEAGLCITCGQNDAPLGRVTCFKCIRRRGQLENKLIAEGTCPRCRKRPRESEHANCAQCRAKLREAVTQRRVALRKALFDKFGRICRCCGESNEFFLCFDHVNNDGKAHRLENKGSSVKFYKQLLSDECSYEIQVLCHNCNMAKEFYGECPHQWATKAATV